MFYYVTAIKLLENRGYFTFNISSSSLFLLFFSNECASTIELDFSKICTDSNATNRQKIRKTIFLIFVKLYLPDLKRAKELFYLSYYCKEVF